jgi:NADPH:quinone reductase-like Zn-dependent oxidoreductase
MRRAYRLPQRDAAVQSDLRQAAAITPQNAANYPSVKVVFVFSHFDRKTLEFMAEAVRDGKLVIPIGKKLPLSEAAEAQAEAEKGGIGKILLLP